MVKIKKKNNKTCCNKIALCLLSALIVALVVVITVCLICTNAENAKLSRFSKWMAYGFAIDNCKNITPSDGKDYYCALYDYNATASSPYLKYYYTEMNQETNEIIGNEWYDLTVYFDLVEPNGSNDSGASKDLYRQRIELSDVTYPIDHFLITK